MGILLFWLFNEASIATENEASQRLYLELAENIVKDLGITSNGEFDTEMIKDAFHQMMILGPAIELYIVDKEGNLVAYDAPEEKIKLKKIDLKPVTTFVQRRRELPILGDDPRSANKQKIFSAARVYAKNNKSENQNDDGMGVFVGYLYIIIGGENYDSVATALRLSQAWKISLIGVSGGLLFLLLASLLLFYALTRPLRKLTKEIKEFENSDFKITTGKPSLDLMGNGELSQLEYSFHKMEQRMVAQLERLNKQDNIRREFLSYVSHDLRTPLAGMKAYLETLELKQESMSLEERRGFLQKAITNGERLEGMINELFELTRLESNQVEVNKDGFVIGDLLSDIYVSLEGKASQRQVQLKIDCHNPSEQVYADIAKIERVIQNLTENAVRYSPNGGVVVIKTEGLGTSGIMIKIIDSGSGISPQHLPYIFEPYYRAPDENKLKYKGAGLGLAISQRLLALQGISLNVESEEGKGTVFSFVLTSYKN